MVEPIRELERICLPDRTVRGRIGEHWITAKFQRRLSIRLTWLLLHTPITANQVSILGFLIGAAGAALVSTANYYYTVTAALMLYVSEILDSCDGEIARYRKTSGVKGEMIEGVLNSSLVHAFFFLGIAWNAFTTTGNPLVFCTAAIGIIFAVKFDHAKELAKEYQEKAFHSSPLDTVSKVTSSPPTLIKFLGESKHMRQFLILVSAVFGALYWFILVYPFFVLAAYIVFVVKFLGKIDNKKT